MLQEGPPIWVESILTRAEWAEGYKKYSTYKLKEPPPEFECEFKWRKGMGAPISAQEIANINAGIDKLRIILTEKLQKA